MDHRRGGCSVSGAHPESQPDVIELTLYFIMVDHPLKGLTRVGRAYSSRKAANGWTGFVSSAWRGLPARVDECLLRWENGILTNECRETLDKKFNMTPPEAPPSADYLERLKQQTASKKGRKRAAPRD